MLTKLEVRTKRGTLLTLPFYEDDGGYKVAAVDGLDPVEAVLVSSSYAGLDGEQGHSARRAARDLGIALDLEPDYVDDTITSLRKKLYSFFMPKSEVYLRFFEETGIYYDIKGQVSDFDAPLFVKDADIQINLRCFQPDFVDPRIVKLTRATVADQTTFNIDYPGTVDTGTILTLRPQRALSAFTIYNSGEDNVQRQFDFAAPLQIGDKLVISSLRGSKGITLTRAGTSQSYLYGRSTTANWIELTEGINKFRVFANGDPIPYDLEYVVRYGGL